MKTTIPFNKLLIIGLGLIGGSLARALSKYTAGCEIIAYDLDSERLKLAQKQGYVHRITTRLAETIPEADLVVWALPVQAICSGLAEYAAYFVKDQIVTDVGSVKRIIAEAAAVLPAGTIFIGGHPMAGKEASGLEKSDPNLFAGKPWVLVQDDDRNQAAVEKLAQVITAIRARPVQMSAAEHDRTVAVLSHLPQLVSSCLMSTVGEQVEDLPTGYLLAGRGLVDTTRIAGSNPKMWQDILLANHDQLLQLLDLVTARLQDMRNALAARNPEAIVKQLQLAQAKKQLMLAGSFLGTASLALHKIKQAPN